MENEKIFHPDETGYVEVADDPMHQEVYADRYFRAYVAVIAPGQATRYHRHSEDTLYLVINGGRMGNKNFKGHKRSPMVFPRSFPFYQKLLLALQNTFTGSAHLPDGLFFFMPTRKYPSIHLAAASSHNRDSVCLMGIEIRHHPDNRPPSAPNALPFRVEYDNGVLRVLVRTFAPKASDRMVLPGFQLFMVCTKGMFEVTHKSAPDKESDIRHLARGNYLCISGDLPATVRNPGVGTSKLVILAIPRDSPR